MATTAGGFPYPVGTDKVRDGDDAIKALADVLQQRTLGLMFISSQVIVTTNAAGGFGVTFPRAFRAGASPLVICADGDANASSINQIGVMFAPTATTFSGVIRNAAGQYPPTGSAIRLTYLAIGVAP